jgi:hypothetical protein
MQKESLNVRQTNTFLAGFLFALGRAAAFAVIVSILVAVAVAVLYFMPG